MFETHVGALQDASSLAYLRPETAQGIFVNFKNVAQLARRKPPFGIAQVGKSFRNEITPGNFLFRVREFEQMEMEYFVPPAQADQWYRYWIDARFEWYVKYGLRRSRLRIHLQISPFPRSAATPDTTPRGARAGAPRTSSTPRARRMLHARTRTSRARSRRSETRA